MSECVIIGGGLIGLLTARELALDGVRVKVLDKGGIGKESSWAGGGILSPLYPWRYENPVTDLACWGQTHYQALAQSLLSDTGLDPEWTQTGMLCLDEEWEAASRWAKQHDKDLQQVGTERLCALEPELRSVFQSGIWMPEVAQIRNPRLVKALASSLVSKGVKLIEGTEVKRIDFEQGKVQGVDTSDGKLSADIVVVAGGAWTADVVAQTGIELPITPVRGQMVMVRSQPGFLNRVVLHKGYYLIPRRDGRVLVGSTIENVGFDKGVTDQARQDLLTAAIALVPGLSAYPVEAHWSGLRPGNPSGIPFIGAHPKIQGLYVNSGHYRNGVVLAPASARLLADLVLDRKTILAPHAYKLART